MSSSIQESSPESPSSELPCPSQSQQSPKPFDRIPIEVLMVILDHVDPKTFVNALCSCKRFYESAKKNISALKRHLKHIPGCFEDSSPIQSNLLLPLFLRRAAWNLIGFYPKETIYHYLGPYNINIGASTLANIYPQTDNIAFFALVREGLPKVNIYRLEDSLADSLFLQISVPFNCTSYENVDIVRSSISSAYRDPTTFIFTLLVRYQVSESSLEYKLLHYVIDTSIYKGPNHFITEPTQIWRIMSLPNQRPLVLSTSRLGAIISWNGQLLRDRRSNSRFYSDSRQAIANWNHLSDEIDAYEYDFGGTLDFPNYQLRQIEFSNNEALLHGSFGPSLRYHSGYLERRAGPTLNASILDNVLIFANIDTGVVVGVSDESNAMTVSLNINLPHWFEYDAQSKISNFLTVGFEEPVSLFKTFAFVCHSSSPPPEDDMPSNDDFHWGRIESTNWQIAATLLDFPQGTSLPGTAMAINANGTRIAAANWKDLFVWTMKPDELVRVVYKSDPRVRRIISPTRYKSDGVIHDMKFNGKTDQLFALTDIGLKMWDFGDLSTYSTKKATTIGLAD
ncbi:MAG: hypothetical protein M1834_006717 [Cirrosporium novae-zelandiae]|nr:MAG: hypothetical protein M1834_006717 [Cirrosporium novae-zelandiae]